MKPKRRIVFGIVLLIISYEVILWALSEYFFAFKEIDKYNGETYTYYSFNDRLFTGANTILVGILIAYFSYLLIRKK